MNEQIERRLDAESTSESAGYVGGLSGGRAAGLPGGNGVPSLNGVLKLGPAGWAAGPADVEVEPLASVSELLDVAKSERR